MSHMSTIRGPDAGTLLRRAIERSADAHGLSLAVVATDMTRWASATFTGARHKLTIAGDAQPLLDRWIAALPDLDLPLRRHLVADIAVLGVARAADQVTITLEALTVEE